MQKTGEGRRRVKSPGIGGRGVEAKASEVSRRCCFQATRDDETAACSGRSLVSGGGATKTNTPRDPIRSRPPSHFLRFSPVGQRPVAWVTQQNVSYTRPTAALVQGSLRNHTVHRHHVGCLRPRKRMAQLPLHLCALWPPKASTTSARTGVRWPGITTQCANAIALVGALNHTAQPIKTQSQMGLQRIRRR